MPVFYNEIIRKDIFEYILFSFNQFSDEIHLYKAIEVEQRLITNYSNKSQ